MTQVKISRKPISEMRHQIILVGGQLLPVFVGIKEFSPDFIHFIVSSESKGNLKSLKNVLSATPFTEYVCDPYDFNSIRNVAMEILDCIGLDSTIQFNLTSGTKIMFLAAQSLIQERQVSGFYINQNDTLITLPSYYERPLVCKMKTNDFIELSGHKIIKSTRLSDLPKEDLFSSILIHDFANKNRNYNLIQTYFRKHYLDSKLKIPETGTANISKELTFNWAKKSIDVTSGNDVVLSVESSSIRNLFFYGGWWELIVAEQISQWKGIDELLIQCELPFKADDRTLKSEIDILVNLGRRLFFVECKSGNVKQEDINKMKVIKDTYGGIISKSILVSRFRPSKTISEKCMELNIEVFYMFDDKRLVNSMDSLIPILEKVKKSVSL